MQAVNIPIGLKPSAEVGFPRCVALAKLSVEAGAAWVANVTAGLDGRPTGHIPGWPISLGEGWSRHKPFRRNLWADQSLSLPENHGHHRQVCARGGHHGYRWACKRGARGRDADARRQDGGPLVRVFWKGRALLRNSVSFLSRFLDEHGYESVRDIVGLGLQYIQPVDDTADWKVGQISARVDTAKCNNCGICSDSFCPVPATRGDGYPWIDESEMSGLRDVRRNMPVRGHLNREDRLREGWRLLTERQQTASTGVRGVHGTEGQQR